jgi:hypothetical protein
MLGEQIVSGRGRRSGRRVTATSPKLVVEVSFEDRSSMLGIDGGNIGTYVSSTRPDGTLEGEGQGVFAAPDGQIAAWKAVGNGRYMADGAVSYRGGIVFSSASPVFARLNAVAGVFEFEVDAEGNTSSKIWEWK